MGSEQSSTYSKKPGPGILLGMVLSDLGPRQVKEVLKKLEPRLVDLSKGIEPPPLPDETLDAIGRLLLLGEQHAPTTKRGSVTGSLAIERL